jgi:hypothetical protein
MKVTNENKTRVDKLVWEKEIQAEAIASIRQQNSKSSMLKKFANKTKFDCKHTEILKQRAPSVCPAWPPATRFGTRPPRPRRPRQHPRRLRPMHRNRAAPSVH